ncbi:hypothetical protein HYW99_02170 [Candidatus Woesearchaeota archaeon]|nr:hypothetical protein [Candidatus Woesearchaeota archaeon]
MSKLKFLADEDVDSRLIFSSKDLCISSNIGYIDFERESWGSFSLLCNPFLFSFTFAKNFFFGEEIF